MNDFTEPREVLRLLQEVGCRWGVAGGWALDLFLDRVTRKHEDIEIAVFREDQFILREYLRLAVGPLSPFAMVSYFLGRLGKGWYCRFTRSGVESLMARCGVWKYY
jgi:hypothetical protein